MNGSVVCWGSDTGGKLGDGDDGQANEYVPVFIDALYGFTEVDLGRDHACGVLVNGSVACWGSDADGEIGDGGGSVTQYGPVLADYAYRFGYGTNAYLGSSVLVSMFNASGISSGTNITFACGAYDVYLDALFVNASYVLPFAPIMNNSRMSPVAPLTGDDLVGYCNATDTVGDTLSYYYRWYVNGMLNLTGATPQSYTQGTEINVANISSSWTSLGDNWTLSCLASDGVSNSSWMNSSAAIVGDYFVSTWNTSANSTGSSNKSQVTLPLVNHVSSSYNFTVYWGDGTSSEITSWDDTDKTHDYDSEGVYTISINGTIAGWRFNNGGDRLKLLDISHWGPLRLGNANGYFYGVSNLQVTATDILNMTGTTTMANAFSYASSLTTVPSMDDWDMGKVTSMTQMFYRAYDFNQNLSSWDTSNVTSMSYMFGRASSFDGNISTWNTSKVTHMDGMLFLSDFNQSIEDWDTSNVVNMDMMFYGLTRFNQNLSGWNTSKVTNMDALFWAASSFNGDITTWDTSKVTRMRVMFDDATSFNQDISGWDTSNLAIADNMFNGASSFDQDISGWDTHNITTMNNMFNGATSFDQDLGNWNISSLTDAANMFNGVTLATSNYDSLLNGWAAQTPSIQSNVTFSGGNSLYSIGALSARNDTLIGTYNWTITDGGMGGLSGPSFNTTWNTSKTGVSGSAQVALPLESTGTYDFYVVGTTLNNSPVHITSYTDNILNFSAPGVHNISIYGTIDGWRFNNGGDRLKLLEISNWGQLKLGNSSGYFYGAANLEITATDILNMTGTTSMSSAFRGCSAITTIPSMNGWDMGEVTTFDYMFASATNFNQDIGGWNTSSVTTTAYMFMSALNFNQNLSGWDTSKVTNMALMFRAAVSFNGNVSSWDTSKVTSMSQMFWGGFAFNGDVSSWNTSNVQYMDQMFREAYVFNQSLNDWDVSKVTSFTALFSQARDFNQPLDHWITSNVSNMAYAFYEADDFDQDISGWDTHKVTTMTYMFAGADVFNQDLSSWETGNVTDMSYMFYLASNFNQDLNGWDTSNVGTMYWMFYAATNFDGNISLWNTSKVASMARMFAQTDFDQDISGWDTSKVTDMYGMFFADGSFNQDISGWETGNVTDMYRMFSGASSFDQDIGSWNVHNLSVADEMFDGVNLSTAHYDSLLLGWSAQDLQNATVFSGGGSMYSCGAAAAARAVMNTTYNWTITDGGSVCDPIMESSAILPNNPNVNDILVGYCAASHPVGTNVSYDYRWYVNGSVNETGTTVQNYTQGVEVNVGNISAPLTSIGDNWTLSCRAFDGDSHSAWLNSSTVTVLDAFHLTSCADLSLPGTYYLMQNVSSAATCMNIWSDNVTLDCQGFTINYSQSSKGYGINDSAGYDDLTIQNCAVEKGSSLPGASYAAGIYVDDVMTHAYNITVVNTSSLMPLYASGELSYAFYFVQVTNLSLDTIVADASTNYTWGKYLTYMSDVENVIVNNSNFHGGAQYAIENKWYVLSNFTMRNSNFTSLRYNALMFSTCVDCDIDQSNLVEGLPILFNSSISDVVVLNNTNASSLYGAVFCISCDNVTYNNVTFGNDGLELYDVTNSRFTNLNVQSHYGISWLSGVDGCYFENVSFVPTTLSEMYFVVHNSNFSHVNFSHVRDWGSTNTRIDNFNFFGYMQYTYAPSFMFSNGLFKTAYPCLNTDVAHDSVSNFYNMTFNCSTSFDFRNSYGNNIINLYNATFTNNLSIDFDGTTTNKVYRYEYADVNVTNASGSMLVGANITATDTNGTLRASALSSDTSLTRLTLLTNYYSFVANVSYNNYTFAASKPFYGSNSTAVNVTSSSYVLADSINLSLSRTTPEVLGVLLNSTLGTNLTSEDLTVYVAANNSMTTIADWRLNGTSIALLNTPFDTNYTGTSSGGVRDYSSFEHNGTIVGSPVWSDGCVVGGCYDFDGSNDYITYGDVDHADTAAVAAWIYRDPADTDRAYVGIVDKWSCGVSTSDWSLTLHNGAYDFWVSNGTGYTSATYGTAPKGVWVHVALVYNGTHMLGFVNGSLVTSKPFVGGLNDGSVALTVGVNTCNTNKFFGKIDEVLFFNRSLSSAQMAALYAAGLANHSMTAWLSEETSVGDNYTVMVTPNDGFQDGASVLSNSLAVLSGNNPPVIVLNNTFVNSSSAHAFTVTAGVSDSNTAADIANTTLNGASCSYTSNATAGNYFNVTYTCTGTPYQSESLNITFCDSENQCVTTPTSSNAYPNQAPAQPSLIAPANNNYSIRVRNVYFNWSSSDPESDPINYTLNVTNGFCDDYLRLNLSSTSHTTASELGTEYECNDHVYEWKVQACDAWDCSVYSTTFNFSIDDYLDIAIVNTVVDFSASFLPGQSEDSADGSPAPFLFRNDGIIKANLTNVSATSLWQSVPLDTVYYRFKANRSSSEPDSFDFAGSVTDWQNADTQASLQTFIGSLNYSDGADEAAIDVLIEVPPSEPATAKTSTVTFSWGAAS